jgi:hypothetical protein
MNEVKHTPLPWSYDKHDKDSSYHGNVIGHYPNGNIRTITTNLKYGTAEENDANAEFIIRAVNCHDELLAACDEVLSEWHSHASNFNKREPAYLERIRRIIRKAKSTEEEMNENRERGMLSVHEYDKGQMPFVVGQGEEDSFTACHRSIGVGDKIVAQVIMHRGAPGYPRLDNYESLLDTTQHLIACWNAFEQAGIDPADAVITKREGI